ncbi:MAG: hypothetical protein ABR950_04930 [Candidatus Dormibacteria bacterium]|jgi:hypothetical protein
MTSNGQGPSPRPRDGEPRRHARGTEARRHDAGSRWGLLAAASRRDRGTTPTAGGRGERHLSWAASLAVASRPATSQRDDAGADFVLQAMQRAFQ